MDRPAVVFLGRRCEDRDELLDNKGSEAWEKPGKGYFDVVMRNGESLEIALPPFASFGPSPLVRAYPEVSRALDGVAFAFNSKDVSPECVYANVLLQRP